MTGENIPASNWIIWTLHIKCSQMNWMIHFIFMRGWWFYITWLGWASNRIRINPVTIIYASTTTMNEMIPDRLIKSVANMNQKLKPSPAELPNIQSDEPENWRRRINHCSNPTAKPIIKYAAVRTAMDSSSTFNPSGISSRVKNISGYQQGQWRSTKLKYGRSAGGPATEQGRWGQSWKRRIPQHFGGT